MDHNHSPQIICLTISPSDNATAVEVPESRRNSRVPFDRDHLTRGTSWDVLASGAVIASSDGNIGPGPVGARSTTAEDIDVRSTRCDGAGDAVDGQVGDRDASGWSARRGTVLVVLLDDDAILGDVLERDVLVGDALHGASGAGDGLDANTIG